MDLNRYEASEKGLGAAGAVLAPVENIRSTDNDSRPNSLAERRGPKPEEGPYARNLLQTTKASDACL